MLTLAGPGSKVEFTSLSPTSCQSLETIFQQNQLNSECATSGVHVPGVLELMKLRSIPLERVCLLDPKAPQELKPEDGDGPFDCFLFGVK